MNPAQPKHAEIPEHGPSIRLRLEIELPLESPDLFRCLQAHRQSPRLLSVKSAPEVRVLPSAGITRHQRYYHPFRFPPAPPPDVTLRPLPSPATGLPRLPVSPSLRAVPTTPADRNGCIRRLLPHSTRPSPNLRRVGVHIFTFEACSGFTRVRPARSLNRPGRPLSQGFGPAGYPTRPPVSYQIKPTTVWVDPSSTGVTRRRGARRVEEGRGGLYRIGITPFPFPAHQTGRANFPHPAFRLASSRGTRRGAKMNPAQPKHAEIPEHGPSIRLRLEIELPLESPDLFRCLQAHRQSPRLLSVKSAPEVRVLPSAGITRHQRYYHPFRFPPAPPPDVTLRPLPSPATGLPRLPVSPSLRAVPTTPADRNGCIRRLLPHSTRPSPNLRRVGVHIFTFEACSGFTRVRPARSLNRPGRPLSQGFGPAGYPTRPPVSYQIKPTTVWVDPSSTGVTRRRGARRVEEGRGGLYRIGITPFPFPAHQTGRANFPHPAFRLASSRGTRRGAKMNPAQPKHAEIPEHGPSIRLRLEIELPLESPDLFRCLQAHRQSPRLLSVKSAPEVRVLPSAGITRHQRYYHPFRFPPAPPPDVTLRPLPSPATGLPRLPVSPSLRAVPTTPADRNGCIRRLLPHSTRPSPNLRRVGVHIFTFEACSGFTRVRPARSLNRPGRPLSQGFGPAGYPTRPPVSYQIKPTTVWVDPSSTGVTRRRGARRVEEGRGGLYRIGITPFPFPAHQTGRANFPHPAFRLASSRGTRRGAKMNPAQPKHAEIPEHGPSIRLRLEIELPLESPDLFRCLQAHRQSPRLLSVKSAPEVRVLPSAGITRHQRYYHPFRFPPAPPPDVTLRPLPSPATGLPRLPVSPSLRAVPTTPADRNGCIRRLLPHSTRPSPNLRRVGVHIFTFEACSGFTRVRPARSLNRPGRPLSQGFGPAGYPTRPPVSYQIKPTTVWVDPSSTGVTRRRGARRVEEGRGGLYRIGITPFPFPAHQTGRRRISRIRLSDWLHPEAHGGGPR